ncbi:MAG: hypothetical protein R3C05_02920 [Pirellulaceae bacterium]
MSSDDTTEATVPLTVTIPMAATRRHLISPRVDDSIVDATQTATITASADGFVADSDSVQITNVDVPTLFVTLENSSVSEDVERLRRRSFAITTPQLR